MVDRLAGARNGNAAGTRSSTAASGAAVKRTHERQKRPAVGELMGGHDHFELAIGIDYSGAKTPLSRSAALQVYKALPGSVPRIVTSPASSDNRKRHWNRKEIAWWLAEQLQQQRRLIVAIDHGFSFPVDYFQRNQLRDWHQFLEDFVTHWPTRDETVSIDDLRANENSLAQRRRGSSRELRLTEAWSGSAKSVFQFDVQGSVAKSTHAGIPWLHWLRAQFQHQIHWWPYDGWEPPQGKSIFCEGYPTLLRKRYPREGRSADQHDAYCLAAWLRRLVDQQTLGRYLNVPLTDQEREIARREGWILGVL